MENDKVEVFHFLVYDGANDKTVTHLSKRTREDIERIGGKIVEGSGEMVLRSELDAEDRYYPKPRPRT